MTNPMNWPVRKTLTIIFALVFLIFASLEAYLIIANTKNQNHETTQILHKDLAQHVIDEYLLINQGRIDLTETKKLFTELMILGPNFEFYIIDQSGKLITCSIPLNQIRNKTIHTQPIETFLELQSRVQNRIPTETTGWFAGLFEPKTSFPVYGTNPITSSQDALFSAAPILNEGEISGYLYVVFGSQMHSDLALLVSQTKQFKYFVTLFGLLAIFVLLIIWTLSHFVLKPLNLLSTYVHQDLFRNFNPDSQKNLEHLPRWPASSQNEFHHLGAAFQAAYKTLSNQYKQLESNETSRKELLAHLSHDIRTPMASLLGYLETYLLDTSRSNQKEKTQYIEVAKRSAEKVNKLAEHLFELAYLDSHNVSMQIEPFPIAELINDILNNFKIQSDAKHISLELTPKDASILVFGDIEKLDRVFNNLIENAIRHTPAGGQIEVSLQRNNNEVIVSVSDNGLGIASEDIPFIFDAHYKGQNTIRANTSHGGLGLAITKRLLELHEASIQVYSELNKGTRFQFNLKNAST